MFKKILLVLGILVILISVPVAIFLVRQRQELRMKAAPATTLSLSPASISKNAGETFSVDIIVDTGSNTVSAADLYLTYDPLVLKGESLTAGTFLPVELSSGKILDGNASISVGSQPTTPKQGTGTLATITFTALASTGTSPTFIRFRSDTLVAGIGEQGNVLTGAPSPASVTIASAQVTPTPTLTPGITPTPTPTGRPQPTPTPAPQPTSAPSTNGCGGTCGSNSNCNSDLFCSQGFCRNSSCPSKSDCVCSAAATPTPKSTPTPKPQLPKAGFDLPTIGAVVGGVLLLGLAAVLAL